MAKTVSVRNFHQFRTHDTLYFLEILAETMALATMPFSNDTYAIMTHKLYTDRVIEFLTTKGLTFMESMSNQSQVTVLHTPEFSGVSRARRGFSLLLIENVQRPIESLPPMARQNISWIGKISHVTKCPQSIWTTMGLSQLDITSSLLRIDVYPRNRTNFVVMALQESCAKEYGFDIPLDPFEGPISFTKSASKCSHKLIVICYEESEYYLGLLNRTIEKDSKIMDLNLNYAAAEEISVSPSDNTNGHDMQENALSRIPLSRAYYKLDEVWKSYLSNQGAPTWAQGTGIDLGASPGGWTQVLVHEVGLKRVLSVDPGILADRVLNLSPVTHIRSNIISADISSHGPFSVLVCDASDVWINILDQIESIVVDKCEWSLPSVCIITLKLPFKTLKSVKRHADRIKESIPPFLDNISRKMFPGKLNIQVQSKIVHLMANSGSERTLIAIFETAE